MISRRERLLDCKLPGCSSFHALLPPRAPPDRPLALLGVAHLSQPLARWQRATGDRDKPACGDQSGAGSGGVATVILSDAATLLCQANGLEVGVAAGMQRPALHCMLQLQQNADPIL